MTSEFFEFKWGGGTCLLDNCNLHFLAVQGTNIKSTFVVLFAITILNFIKCDTVRNEFNFNSKV